MKNKEPYEREMLPATRRTMKEIVCSSQHLSALAAIYAPACYSVRMSRPQLATVT
jgi:hypothetical protein